MPLNRRGQAVVEYMLLLCSATTLAVLVGTFLQKYLPQITQQLIDLMLRTALEMASPY